MKKIKYYILYTFICLFIIPFICDIIRYITIDYVYNFLTKYFTLFNRNYDNFILFKFIYKQILSFIFIFLFIFKCLYYNKHVYIFNMEDDVYITVISDKGLSSKIILTIDYSTYNKISYRYQYKETFFTIFNFYYKYGNFKKINYEKALDILYDEMDKAKISSIIISKIKRKRRLKKLNKII